MKKIIIALLLFSMISCSSNDDNVEPSQPYEMVSLNWTAKSMNIPLDGSVRVQIYSGAEYKELTYNTHTIVFPAKKGDYIYFMINPKVTDQAQNEAGIDINYVVSISKGAIAEGNTNGFSILIN